jgi:nicotinate-nucleotide--dimethylbenzimidazole phosphoribosyltransferase
MTLPATRSRPSAARRPQHAGGRRLLRLGRSGRQTVAPVGYPVVVRLSYDNEIMSSETSPAFPPSQRAESVEAFLDVLSRRRSIRAGFLREKPVSDELIGKILEAGRWAPSAGNSQPWEFLVVRSSGTREKIVEIYKTQMRDKIEIEEAARGQRRHVNAGLDFRHAPVHILVLGDPRTNDAYPMRTKLDKWEAHYYSSLANCVLQMLLTAEVLGLSSMYVSDVASPYFSVMLKSLLGIPEPLQIYHLLPIGFAKRSPTICHPRRALEEMVHYERYDRSKFRGEAELQEFMQTMSIRGAEYRF